MRGETPIEEVIVPPAVTPDPPRFTPHPTSLRSATFSLKGRRTLSQPAIIPKSATRPMTART